MTIDDVISEFGEPAEVAFSYLESIESEELYKRLSVSRVIKRVIFIILALVIAYFIFIFTLAYMDYLAAQDEHIVKEVIIIE